LNGYLPIRVILKEAERLKNLLGCKREILRSLRSFRMTRFNSFWTPPSDFIRIFCVYQRSGFEIMELFL